MTSRQFVAVALRIFAIWMALSAAQSVLSILLLDEAFSAAPYLAYAVVYAFVAVVLWTFPLTIAGRILRASPDDPPMGATPRGIVHAAIIAAGLILLAGSLPGALNTLAFVVETPFQDYAGPSDRALWLVRLAIPVLEIVLALAMILRADWLLRRIRPEGEEGGL